MQIDCHAHLMGPQVPGEAFWEGFVRLSVTQTGRPAERVRQRLNDIYDLTGERLLREMDEAGVDQAMIMPVDWGLVPAFRSGTMDIWEQHELHAAAVRRHPDRLFAFACFDPRRPDAVALLERAVTDLGMVGLKIHPAAGFFPSDPAVYPLCQKALELKIPVMVHTGPEPKPLYSRHCQPIHVDDLAADFPDLTIILAHAGLGAWWQEAAGVASVAPNVCLDISGWQGMARFRPMEFYSILRSMIAQAGAHRVMWGSDYPALRLLLSEANWVKALREPPEAAAQQGLGLSAEEAAAILGSNAQRVFGR